MNDPMDEAITLLKQANANLSTANVALTDAVEDMRRTHRALTDWSRLLKRATITLLIATVTMVFAVVARLLS